MKKTTTNHKNNVLPRLYCNLFGHDFEVSKKVTSHVNEYTCKHCKKELTTNGNGYLTELTPKYKEINATLERIYTARKLRLQENRLYTSNYGISA
ncbi:MAG: hypothetical protein KDD16_06155 [Mangrovimonas sp.]|nr:hypothetical protein [Mangrovimonas sp.]